jgi:phosphoribosylamine---glycine ligase
MSASSTGRRVVVVGSGGREHALALRLLESPSVKEAIVVPGNAGTSFHPQKPEKVLRSASGDPVEIAKAERADLVVVGPEVPLTEGIVDRIQSHGIAAFGPSAAAARLEGSKAFMKDFATRAGILTARYEVVRDPVDVERAVKSFAEAPVVKADGLCAGKGVVVADSHDEAIAEARAMLSGTRFGDAGRTVVIEERIRGAEASVHAICDGERVLMLPTAQDHKRIGDFDTGPNTGGMGTYAPAPLVGAELFEGVRRSVMERAVTKMAEEGAPYRGALFAGLMITESGVPYLLEFNVRFGDPETQVLMNVVDGDLGDALDGAARGKLVASSLRVSDRHALCVVVAASGYPGTPKTGDIIEGLDQAARLDGVVVYHAGTKLSGQSVAVSGGRVLGVTGRGSTLAAARDAAYGAVERIRFPGMQYRTDIGAKAL